MSKLSSHDIIASLKAMTMLELNDLVKAIETEFGVTAAAPMASAGAAPAAVEQSSEVTIHLDEVGANKVGVIKVVREVTGLGLMEAKTLVDSAPKKVKENVKREEAMEIQKKFTDAGAKVSLK